MKKYTWAVVISLGLFIACEPINRGESSIDESDNTPPGVVESPQVENIPGGAVITYENPPDEDLLYVKAEYERKAGEVVEQKTSVFDSGLEIEGFGKSRKVDVQLTAVDRNNNESDPVTVEAEPLDSYIFDIHSSVSTVDNFGGIQVSWENPNGVPIVLTILAEDDSGEWEVAETFFTSSEEGLGNVRGYDDSEREFGVVVEDRWENATDTLSRVHNPLFEERIPPDTFSRWNPPGIPYNEFPGWNIENIWDGSFANPGFLFNTGSQFPEYPYSFTFDMGVEVKLSRFKFVQRQDVMYAIQQVRRFELWGAKSEDGLNEDYSSGWEYLGEFEIEKPSGLPLGELSDEDVQAANEGHDFNADPDAPTFRYLRVDVTGKWQETVATSLTEMQFWGEMQDDGE